MALQKSSRPAPIAEMHRLVRDARYKEAAQLYDAFAAAGRSAPLESLFLRAKLQVKADAAAGVRFLLHNRDRIVSRHERAIAELYLGIAYGRMREFAQADSHFTEAARLASRTLRFLAELAYERARRYLLELRTPEAWECYQATLSDKSLTGRVRSEQLRGFILAQEERYVDQALSLMKVINAIKRRHTDYLETWYLAIHTLAALARELAIPEALSLAQTALEDIDNWSPDFAINHFQALKAVGWCKALSGDQLSCFRYLRRAQSVAPDAAWRAMVHLDRAYFARSIGEEQWSMNEIAQAEEIGEGVDWNACQSEERVALLLFAELLSAVDGEKAAYYMGRYNTLDKLGSPVFHFAFDQRLKALSDCTNGLVREANGAPDDAVNRLRSAWSTFDRIGYDWRAGRTAMRLFRLTGKSSWRRLAEGKLEHYKHSWLWKDLRDATPPRRTRASRTDLTPSQERIFRMICNGMSTEAIAKKLGRSQSTVRNHLKLIFKKLGVHSRPALVALAAKRDLI